MFLHYIIQKKSFYLEKIFDTDVHPENLLKENSNYKYPLKLKQKLKTSTKIKEWVKDLVKVSSFIFREAFVYPDTIYMDKVAKHERENTVILLCSHCFLDIKKNDILVVTKNLPDFDLHSGMKGCVEKVLIHQRIEVKFFYDFLLFSPLLTNQLIQYDHFLIKEKDFYKK